ncbi:hypothetical protein DdX_00846 [Ditylenchus destructor]|uniref:Uncharacterized protein n=1 Tax=Ditylenchus destructor TaxID=166010 RepID=A0AAD4NLC3_9BILA|nr:hypothetical protein DdX_00846 [Ditylenchus destructor]
MNHCIPGRKLHPQEWPLLQGLVITQPMSGQITHYVWREKDDALYKMPARLFVCNAQGLSNTERIRREQVLEFGDNIDFKADSNYNIVDYEKTFKTYESKCAEGKYLLKTICVVKQEKPRIIWTKNFGFIEVAGRYEREVRLQAIPDVALNCWVEIGVEDGTIFRNFYEFESVAQDDRALVWEAEWNRTKVKPSHGLCWESSDEDDFEEKYLEKKDEDVLGVKTRLEGVLIARFEIFCPKLADKRVLVGLWHSDDYKNPPLGHKLIFDAYYSELWDAWILYYYENRFSYYCDIVKGVTVGEYKIHVEILMKNFMHGLYVIPYFGLISDPGSEISILPFLEMPFLDEAVEVYIKDVGEESEVSRFEIWELLPATKQIVEKAEAVLAEMTIEGDGIILNQFGQVYSHKYPSAQFYLSEGSDMYPPGTWVRFQSKYYPNDQLHFICKFEKIYEKPSIECRSLLCTEGCSKDLCYHTRYEFKIEVEFHPTYKNLLFHQLFGFVGNPEKKFVSNARYKKFAVIVEEETDENAVTLFRIKRMAKSNERLSNNSHQIRASCDFGGNSNDLDVFQELDNALNDENQGPAFSNVEYCSLHAKRERALIARRRKKEREQAAKEALLLSTGQN